MKSFLRRQFGKKKGILVAIALAIPIIFLMLLCYSLLEKKINTFNDPGTGIIVIDPGHGGIDGGTSSNGLLEKEINLSIAKRLKKVLLDNGFTVVMTREEDVSLDGLAPGTGGRHRKDLEARLNMINSSNAQLFVSIHVNSNYNNKAADGSIIFYGTRLSHSKDLAYCVQRSLNTVKIGEMSRTVRNPQPAGYFLLNGSQIPGIIAEVAFISNRGEWEAMATDEFRDNIARSLAAGIEKYYDTMHIYRPRIASEEAVSGKLAIIIDDFGQDRKGVKEMMSINRHLTFAVMPFLEFSQKDAIEAHEKGFEVIVHLPMEPNQGKMSWLGPRPIMSDLKEEEITSIVNDAFENVPYAVGANIHMGSKASGDETIMSVILNVMKEKGVYFVDSRTANHPIAYGLAAAKGIHCYDRQLFLDEGRSKSQVMKRLETAMDYAAKHGKAIAIGHVGAEGGRSTAQAIEEMLPEFDRNGVKLVFVSELDN